MCSLLHVDLTVYTDQWLCLQSRLTKKPFHPLPPVAQSPVTALSQASGYFSVPRCQQRDVLLRCVLGANHFRPAQYWLREQDTGLITSLNGWYGSRMRELEYWLTGTSCRFLSPYSREPWRRETVLETTLTYHHFSSIGRQIIPLSSCLSHLLVAQEKAMHSLATCLSFLQLIQKPQSLLRKSCLSQYWPLKTAAGRGQGECMLQYKQGGEYNKA